MPMDPPAVIARLAVVRFSARVPPTLWPASRITLPAAMRVVLSVSPSMLPLLFFSSTVPVPFLALTAATFIVPPDCETVMSPPAVRLFTATVPLPRPSHMEPPAVATTVPPCKASALVEEPMSFPAVRVTVPEPLRSVALFGFRIDPLVAVTVMSLLPLPLGEKLEPKAMSPQVAVTTMGLLAALKKLLPSVTRFLSLSNPVEVGRVT